MSIIFNEKTQAFCLSTPNTTYAMAITNDGSVLRHLYWGSKIRKIDSLNDFTQDVLSSFAATDAALDGETSSENLLHECACMGGCDMSTPAFNAICDGFHMLVAPKVKSWEIIQGKPKLCDLPQTYIENDDEATTLEVTIEDESGIRIILSYTVYENIDAIVRHAVIRNVSDRPFVLKSALSASVDFDDRDFELLHLDGAWARERHIGRTPLMNGVQTVGSRRGASGHLHNPFIALVRPTTTETSGECYGFNLVYSGNFVAGCDLSSLTGRLRTFIGINPDGFEWHLNPGESFTTPEAVMVYSAKGLTDMSQTYHELYRTRLCRGKWRDSVRPVLINNWEATYFNFNEDKILDIAKQAKDLGVELMVLDDGWFGKRDNDDCSLGDWFEHKDKLPNGIEALASKVVDMGLKFGLWFEPEMISPDSELHRAHPDWHIHIPGRTASVSRKQWILDLSRKEVQDYVIDAVAHILKKADISYVKWDMNRNMSEIGSAALAPERMGEFCHRYILGVYRIMDELVTAFPDVLFEGCSGGGGRFDPGILYYMPQYWTSDDSDAVERLKIQYGTSIAYPTITMGAHVSAVPNHQVHRTTPLKMRGDVAMMGQFGYELAPATLSDEEKAEVKEQIIFYKKIREVVQFGKMYRLKSPFEGNISAWDFVSEDKNTVVLCIYNVLGYAAPKAEWIRLCGLDPNADYKVDGTDVVYGGDVLMNSGVKRRYDHDFVSEIIVLKKV